MFFAISPSWKEATRIVLAALLVVVASAGMTTGITAGQEPGEEEYYRLYDVNELGAIPILTYHNFTTDPAATDALTRHVDDFRSDLQWLSDYSFHVISMRSLIDNRIDAPAGTHPVVLAFEGSLPSQFQWVTNDAGELVPDPDSAVGVLEAFAAENPEFGKGGHFGVAPATCFASEQAGNSWDESCVAKLRWLTNNGYEVGNHTYNGVSLQEASAEQAVEEVGMAVRFIDDNVRGLGNMSRFLTIAEGEELAPDNPVRAQLVDGFTWDGIDYQIEGMLSGTGQPAVSPASSLWDGMSITRINTDPDSIATWFGAFERGEYPLYTSDGDPNTVAIPDPVAESLETEFDPALIDGSGRTLVRFTASSLVPLTERPELAPGVVVYAAEHGLRLRAEPTTNSGIVTFLRARTELTIVDGPVAADGFNWWWVRLGDGAEGWVVEDFLAGPPAA